MKIKFLKAYYCTFNQHLLQLHKGFKNVCCLHSLNKVYLKFIWTPCAQLYSIAEPHLPHLGSYTRALLVIKDRWHLCVTPWLPSYSLIASSRNLSVSLIKGSKASTGSFSFARAKPLKDVNSMFITVFIWSFSRPHCAFIFSCFKHTSMFHVHSPTRININD